MTPAARIAAAIGILDDVLAGGAAERLLTGWGRRNRFAGSADRAAIRDHVFDALRCRRSFGWLGGADTGRGLMLGALRSAGLEPGRVVFTGEGYGPDPIGPDEQPLGDLADAPVPVQLDMPDWLMPELARSLGDDLAPVAQALRQRAPVFLRVNLARAGRGLAASALAAENIQTVPHDLSPTALLVTGNARRVRNSGAYRDGLVELQDAASQAVVDALPAADRVLDYCAGGGGKSLALAARGAAVTAHDAAPARMHDIPTRAARAGAVITTVTSKELPQQSPFDLVLCDAPCSGSGAWRRSPHAKWLLTPGDLRQLCDRQSEILEQARRFVAPGGVLAYATCSLLRAENHDRIARFLSRNPGWSQSRARQFTPRDGGDGFYMTCLTLNAKHS